LGLLVQFKHDSVIVALGVGTDAQDDDIFMGRLHIPEILWALLLTGTMEHRYCLNCLRRIAVECCEWFLKNDQNAEAKEDKETGHDFKVIADHTMLVEISDEEFNKFLSVSLLEPL
jgi:hypothetical protein